MIDPEQPTDEELVRLAQAEREAGVPDMQTAEAAAAAAERLTAADERDSAAHPS